MLQIHTPDSGEANAMTFDIPAPQPGIYTVYIQYRWVQRGDHTCCRVCYCNFTNVFLSVVLHEVGELFFSSFLLYRPATEEDTQFKALEVLMLDDNKLTSGAFNSLANLKRS